MDIKFTFEDGSEALAHYGVKGMKWRKHKAQEEGYQIDAEKFGYENNDEGRRWSYEVEGLHRTMSREQAARHMAKRNAYYDNLRKQSGRKRTAHGRENAKLFKKKDKYLVNSLPTRKQMRKNERKAALKRRLEQAGR